MIANGCLRVDDRQIIIRLANPTVNGQTVAHEMQTGALFPRVPSRTDIIQGAIGNCYSLASINAVVTRPSGPDVILDSMLDQLNGQVIVRLYIEGSWRYYSVEKSIYRRWGAAHHSRGALWVNVLEKAVMMLIANKDYEKETGSVSGPVLEALLGPAGAQTSSNPATILNTLLSFCYQNSPRWKQAQQQSAVENIFLGAADNDYTEFLRWNDARKAGYWQVKKVSEQTAAALAKHIEGLAPSCKAKILSYAIGMDCVETVNHYTRQERDIYARIGRALATQQSVTAATQLVSTGTRSLGDKMKGGTVGEQRRAGIFEKHVYTVVGVDSRPPNLLGIVLRNPHGATGRDYKKDSAGNLVTDANGKLQSSATSAGEFWMELKEFCTDFQYTVGAKVVTADRQNFMATLQDELVKKKAQLRSPGAPKPQGA